MPTTEFETPVSTTEQPERRPRVFYLDALRCYAIICVVLLHAITPYFTNAAYFGTRSWIAMLSLNPFCRTAVAVFFMISGHLLLNDPLADNMRSFYKKRIPRLIIPLFTWNIIYYLYYDVMWGRIDDYSAQFLGRGTAYHMWYVYTLIGIYLLAPFLKKITDACSKGQVTGLFILLISMTTIRPFINMVTPLSINLFEPLMQGYIGFILIGYLLGSVDFSRWQRVLFYIGGVAGYVLSVVFVYTGSTAEKLDFSINAAYSLPRFLIAAALFVLAKQLFGKSDGQGSVARVVSRCAEIVFGVYWVHVLVLEELKRLFFMEATPLVQGLVRFALAFVISAVVAAIINRVKPMKKYLM